MTNFAPLRRYPYSGCQVTLLFCQPNAAAKRDSVAGLLRAMSVLMSA
jgi:hypothetical protein